MTIGRYEGNGYDISYSAGVSAAAMQGIGRDSKEVTGFFHTHPGHNPDASYKDKTSRNGQLKNYPHLKFFIITNPVTYGKYNKQEYTNAW